MDEGVQAFLDAVTGGDDAAAEEFAVALQDAGDEAIPALRDILADPDPDRRWWGPRALAAVGTDSAIRLLTGVLEDVDPDVRACAVVALSEIKPTDAIGPLIARLSDPSAYVSRLSADALAQFGQAAAGALIDALREGETRARAGAARALSAIQPEEAIPALYEALDDPSALVTYYAEDALEKMGVGILLFRP